MQAQFRTFLFASFWLFHFTVANMYDCICCRRKEFMDKNIKFSNLFEDQLVLRFQFYFPKPAFSRGGKGLGPTLIKFKMFHHFRVKHFFYLLDDNIII